MDFERRCWAQVDLDALRHNFSIIKNAACGTQVMAVVKADAYGHGDVAVARLLAAEGAAGFAVSGLAEALRLRRAGLTQPVLVLGYTSPAAAATLAENDITQCVYSTDYAAALHAAAKAADVRVNVHIKVDTGMGRIGFAARDGVVAAAEEIAAVCRLPHLHATGAFMHFAVADETAQNSVQYTRRQFTVFMQTLDTLADKGITFAVRHCCNSAGAFMYPEMHLDMVRAGIILYGCNPSGETVLPGLTPALQLKCVVSHIKKVPTGDSVSYGRTFTADKEMTLATLTVGYADGYPRALSNRGTASIHGLPAKVVGRVCMDQLLVDVSDIPQVQVGDEAVVLGPAPANSADDIAEMTGTINYEVLCALSHRVQRVYVENSQEVAITDYLQYGE